MLSFTYLDLRCFAKKPSIGRWHHVLSRQYIVTKCYHQFSIPRIPKIRPYSIPPALCPKLEIWIVSVLVWCRTFLSSNLTRFWCLLYSIHWDLKHFHSIESIRETNALLIRKFQYFNQINGIIFPQKWRSTIFYRDFLAQIIIHQTKSELFLHCYFFKQLCLGTFGTLACYSVRWLSVLW